MHKHIKLTPMFIHLDFIRFCLMMFNVGKTITIIFGIWDWLYTSIAANGNGETGGWLMALCCPQYSMFHLLCDFLI